MKAVSFLEHVSLLCYSGSTCKVQLRYVLNFIHVSVCIYCLITKYSMVVTRVADIECSCVICMHVY